MATYILDEAQAEAVYLALKGDSNEATLVKTKKLLELQRLPHAVLEVQQQLQLLQGTGVDNPGLLRIFNPQHDLLADTATSDAAAKVNRADKHTRDMFDGVGGVDDSETSEPAADPISDMFGDNPEVPYPRPVVGQLIVQPSGMSASIGEVLGWDKERAAFRVTDVDGWDGFVFSYGKRDAAEWRILSQALDYADASDFTKQPEGTVLAIARELATHGQTLLAGPERLDDEAYHEHAGKVVPLLLLVNAAANPAYVTQHATDELVAADDNAHALGRLAMQYAEIELANAEPQQPGADPLADVHEAVRAAGEDALDEDDGEGGLQQQLNDGNVPENEDDNTGDGTTLAEPEPEQAEGKGRGRKPLTHKPAAKKTAGKGGKPAGKRGGRK